MPTPPDVSRIAFLTCAYPRMRASIAAIAIGPIQIAILRSIRQEDYGSFVIAIGLLLPVKWLLSYALEPSLDRQFGKVVKNSTATPGDAVLPLLAGALIGAVLELDDRSLERGGASILMLVLAAVGLWISIRDWPLRRHTLIFPLVCAAAAVMSGSGQASQADLLKLRMQSDAAAVLAWMTVGLFDFLMLRRVMPRTFEEQHAENSHADAL